MNDGRYDGSRRNYFFQAEEMSGIGSYRSRSAFSTTPPYSGNPLNPNPQLPFTKIPPATSWSDNSQQSPYPAACCTPSRTPNP